jgi:hypothetical protein
MHLIELYKSLQDHKVRYLLCGGLAINMYGVPRSTADMDIILELTEDNIALFLKAISTFGYQNALPVSLLELADENKRKMMVQERNLITFSFYSTIYQFVTLDILMDMPFSFNELWQRKQIRKTRITEVLLVSVEDLVALKTYSNREQDVLDIASLKKIFPEKFL